ncbi:ogr/Delta-like zinc finger family protein [Ideonella sp. B508-1]|uniref:ogr/Delta-like zinc finger family protein n=1 Tax=Ideonella sp. B508-1 TaxID=137716 RepID=UPI000A0564E0
MKPASVPRREICCPHCDAPATSSKQLRLSDTAIELTYACSNPACGFRFIGVACAVRTLSLPAVFRPEGALPLDPALTRDELIKALQDSSVVRTAVRPPP